MREQAIIVYAVNGLRNTSRNAVKVKHSDFAFREGYRVLAAADKPIGLQFRAWPGAHDRKHHQLV
jgi:hypothetical protein